MQNPNVPSGQGLPVSIAEKLRRHTKLLDGCLIWTASGTSNNYGQMAHKSGGIRRQLMVHRAAWEEENGAILHGFHVHHRCRNRRCCNVLHMQLVTPKEHAALHAEDRRARREAALEEWFPFRPYHGKKLNDRPIPKRIYVRPPPKTHCPQGHPYEGKNVGISPYGYQYCCACRRASSRKSMAKLRRRRGVVPNGAAIARTYDDLRV